MTNCPEIVQQATEGNFPWFLLLIAIAIAAAAFVWKKGLLGTATEGRIKARLAAIKHEASTWDDKLKEVIQKKAQKEAVVAQPYVPPIQPQPTQPQAQTVSAASTAALRTKEMRLAENAALLAHGVITQQKFDEIRDRILAE